MKKRLLISVLMVVMFLMTACGSETTAVDTIIVQLEAMDETSLDDLFDWFEAGGADEIRDAFPHFPYVVMESFDEADRFIHFDFISTELDVDFLYWEFSLERDFYTYEGHFIEGEALVFHTYYRVSEIEGTLLTSESELIGSWAWLVDEGWLYEFHEDGTGVRGLEGDRLSFTWEFTRESELLIETTSLYDGRAISERWRVRLDEDGTLLLQSLHVVGMVHRYSLVE